MEDRDARASALEMSLKNLGVEKLSKEEVQKMQWESLEAKIGNWIHFMRIAVSSLSLSREEILLLSTEPEKHMHTLTACFKRLYVCTIESLSVLFPEHVGTSYI